MNLQQAWVRSMASIKYPVGRLAARLELRGIRPDDSGRGKVFDLIGSLSSSDAKRLAALLHDGIGIPVSVVVRAHTGAEAIRAYCDAGTQFNREVDING